MNDIKSEVYKLLKKINIANLQEDDKQILLNVFMCTNNSLIRDTVAEIFSDIKYEKAVPYIVKKLKEKSLFKNSGVLIFALEELDSIKFFMDFVEIICTHEYEARLLAFGIVEKYSNQISKRVRNKALETLESYRIKEVNNSNSKGENSTLHFIEQTQKLLKSNSSM